MGLFSRSSASSSSATLDKDVGPLTKEIYLTPRDGITVTKKWTYDEEQLQKVGHRLGRADDRLSSSRR